MRVPSHLLLLLAGSALASCESIRGPEPSTVSTSQVVSTGYWFRGVPRSREPVTSGDVTVNSPMANGAIISLSTWYNLQLTNHTGDGVFPDGQGGEATEIDILGSYNQSFAWLDFTLGFVGYTFPEFGPSTREFYVGATVEALGLAHSLTAYYDSDLLDDYYLSYQASRGFPLDEHWSAAVALLLGYMSDDQARFYFGEKSSGLSDLLLTGSLTYHFDENTSIFLKGAGVTVPDDDLAASLEDQGLDDSGFWLTLGAAWGL